MRDEGEGKVGAWWGGGNVGGWGLIHGRWGRREGGISRCGQGRCTCRRGGFANGEKNQDPNRVVSWCEQIFQHARNFCGGC